jgi:hypothetical protein
VDGAADRPRLHERALLLEGAPDGAVLEAVHTLPERKLGRRRQLRVQPTEHACDANSAPGFGALRQTVPLEAERENLIPGELNHVRLLVRGVGAITRWRRRTPDTCRPSSGSTNTPSSCIADARARR